HEGLAGVVAAIDYLASIGDAFPDSPTRSTSLSGRRLELMVAMGEIQSYELGLAWKLLEALAIRPRFKVWGLAVDQKLSLRVPTIAITMDDRPASAIAEHLAARNIFVWSGNMYALELTERLGLENRGGLLRIGLVHYNTAEEIDRL